MYCKGKGLIHDNQDKRNKYGKNTKREEEKDLRKKIPNMGKRFSLLLHVQPCPGTHPISCVQHVSLILWLHFISSCILHACYTFRPSRPLLLHRPTNIWTVQIMNVDRQPQLQAAVRSPTAFQTCHWHCTQYRHST
jgi:hypothetical protein